MAPRARSMHLLSLGFSVPIAIVGGGALGWFLDGRLGTGPWLALVFLMLGIVAGLRNVLRAASGGGSSGGRASPGGPSGGASG